MTRHRVVGFRWGAARNSLVGAALLSAAALVLPTPLGASTLQQPEQEVVLSGEGAGGAKSMWLDWTRAFATSEANPTIDYIGGGEAEGRRAFLEGRADYFISGVPLDEATVGELAKGDGVISAPIQGTGMAFFVSGPRPEGVRFCDPGLGFDEQTLSFGCAAPVVNLSSVRDGSPGSDLRVYPGVIAGAFLEGGDNSATWARDDMRSQQDGDQCPTVDILGEVECATRILTPLSGLLGMVRTDGSAENVYLQRYLSEIAPDLWRTALTGGGVDPATYGIGERWPLFSTPSRSTNDLLVETIRNWLSPQSSLAPTGGVMTVVTPQSARDAIETERADTDPVHTEMWVPELRNGAGEWVQPTPEAMTKAIEAGGVEPLYAVDHAVQGAWPFTWVNWINLPERGLSVDQTNAAAALLRYQATVGPEKAERLGDGKLTPAMTAQTLEAADRVVASNCKAAGAVVVDEAGAGPFTPEGLAPVFDALGKVPWCQATATTPPPSATTLPFTEPAAPLGGSDPSGGAIVSGYDPSIVTDPGTVPVETTPPAPATTAATEPPSDGGEKKGTPLETISATTPLGLPGTGRRPMDRIATVALGGALFLLLRGLWRGGALQRIAGVGG